VWGYLRRLEPSAAQIHTLEGSSILAPCFRSPAFIAHTGGSASGSAVPTLPTFALPSMAAAGCAGRLAVNPGVLLTQGHVDSIAADIQYHMRPSLLRACGRPSRCRRWRPQGARARESLHDSVPGRAADPCVHGNILIADA